MPALKVTGVQQEIAALRAARDKHKIQVTKAYQNLVEVILRDVVSHTPQWSGNLAASWTVRVGSAAQSASGVNAGLDTGAKITSLTAKRAGDTRAVGLALQRGLEAISTIRYNSRVSIVNSLDYADDVNIGEGPDGNHPIRPVNKFDGMYVPAHGVAMVAYVSMKYGSMRYRDLAYRGRYFDNLTRRSNT